VKRTVENAFRERNMDFILWNKLLSFKNLNSTKCILSQEKKDVQVQIFNLWDMN